MKRPSALVPVIAGFSVMLLLMAALTAIVAERNEKSELAATMRALHEGRYQSLMLAANMPDPFLREEELMRFSGMAGDFIQARDKFLALPLDESEFQLWQKIRDQVRAVQTVVEQVIHLLRTDRLDAARLLIKQTVLPMQESMMAEWGRLVDMQRAKNRTAMAEARQASAKAQRLTLALSAGAFAVGLVIAAFVVRLSRRLEKDLFEEKEHAQITLHAIDDAVVRFDEAQRISYLNPAAEHLLGISNAEAHGQAMDSVLRLTDRSSRNDLTASLVAQTLGGASTSLPATACLISTPGMEFEVEGSCAPIHAHDDTILGGVLVLRDVTQDREMHRKLLWQADHDGLTGLMNRRAFEERLSLILAGKRTAEFPLSVLYIDLDHFKVINDTCGHAAGDELLRRVTRLMQARIRDSDTLARMGGDEFAAVLSACPAVKAEEIASELRDGIGKLRFPWQDKSFQIGASIGIVQVPPHWATLDDCLVAADAACYQAKQNGRGRIVVHHAKEDEA